MIYDISQGIVATECRSDETCDYDLLQIYCLVCFERIFKIAQYEVTGKKADCLSGECYVRRGTVLRKDEELA